MGKTVSKGVNILLKSSLAFKIQKRDNFICKYCGKDGLESALAWHQTAVDHFNPRLKDPERNAEENLITACEYCNSLKGGRKFNTIKDAKVYLEKRKKEKHEEFLKVKKTIRG